MSIAQKISPLSFRATRRWNGMCAKLTTHDQYARCFGGRGGRTNPLGSRAGRLGRPGRMGRLGGGAVLLQLFSFTRGGPAPTGRAIRTTGSKLFREFLRVSSTFARWPAPPQPANSTATAKKANATRHGCRAPAPKAGDFPSQIIREDASVPGLFPRSACFGYADERT